MHKYYLVFWPEEQSVSSVKIESITSPAQEELKCGTECTVKIKKQLHCGKIAATGTFTLET